MPAFCYDARALTLTLIATLVMLSAPLVNAAPADNCSTDIAELVQQTQNVELIATDYSSVSNPFWRWLLNWMDYQRRQFMKGFLLWDLYRAGQSLEAGEYTAAQSALNNYSTKLDLLADWGRLDLAAPGQPDLRATLAALNECIDYLLLPPLVTGLAYMESGGAERNYYVQLPTDYVAESEISASALPGTDSRKPLVIALHGTGGTHERWTDSQIGYDLIDHVGDGAVMVFPNALPDANGSQQWSFNYDFEFFLDLLAELDMRGLQYNPNKIFVTGHSSGAGMVHEIGCRFGDVVRGIAPSAGTLISNECVGSVAVLMSQGVNDRLVKVNIARAAQRFWALYNGYDENVSAPTDLPPCKDHSLLGAANTPYPVYWCEHTEGSLSDFSGHRWASFTGDAVWKFFSSLTEVEPTPEAPPGGGNERAAIPSDTTITFTLKYPADIARPLDGAITLYPEGYLDNPVFAIPNVFLNPVFQVGQVTPGDTVTYTNVPISFFVFGGAPVEFPSNWTLSISVYVAGGTRPTPTPGLDHQVQLPITFASKTAPVEVLGVLQLVPAQCFFNCGP
jgi:predicted esterase